MTNYNIANELTVEDMVKWLQADVEAEAAHDPESAESYFSNDVIFSGEDFALSRAFVGYNGFIVEEIENNRIMRLTPDEKSTIKLALTIHPDVLSLELYLNDGIRGVAEPEGILSVIDDWRNEDDREAKTAERMRLLNLA